ncbi:MAG: hypothetical protein AAB914_03620 [Patescibacteria group bacterium]
MSIILGLVGLRNARHVELLNTSQGRADGNVQIANVNDDGSVNQNITNVENDNRNLGFRPAAVNFSKEPDYKQLGHNNLCFLKKTQ